ncbi:TPA: ComEC/Rec2 family competence protein, partial [Candidatus Avigastranaerophilus faecigallinarum]|nr:ComEC/Rec2 family competence protein [Candidatus Avigastranaerophilus faecigallinarum]
ITLGACLIPFIAQLYAAPLQMYYFNTFSVYAVLANIAIVPVLSIVSFIGFISSIIAMIPAVAKQICYFADLILNPILIYIVKVAETFSKLPHSIIYVKKPLLIQIILYFTIIVSITCLLKFKIKSKKIIITITTLLILFALTFITIPNKNAEVIFFSLGNADAVLLKSPNNEYFLIDTGRSGYLKGASQAKNIIIKYLRDKGIKDINSLILTHFDSDHAGGTIDILKNINVQNLYITETYENTMLSNNIKEYLDSNRINYEIAENIEEIYNKDNFIITIIEPVGELITSENQKSLIVHCKYKDKSLLFMADGDIKTYESIPEKYKKDISIIKSGHHGAKDTINKKMLNNSDLFILSTGGIFYNHPHPQTIRILEENNKKYLRTDYHNAIKLILNNSNYRIYMYSPKTKNFIEKDY